MMSLRSIPSRFERPVPGSVAATLTSPSLISTKYVSRPSHHPCAVLSTRRRRSYVYSPQVLGKTRPSTGDSFSPFFDLSCMFVMEPSWTETSSSNKVRVYPSPSPFIVSGPRVEHDPVHHP